MTGWNLLIGVGDRETSCAPACTTLENAMTPRFSFETQKLLDRADSAIARSIETRQASAKGVAEAQKWVRFVEGNVYRAKTTRNEAAQRRWCWQASLPVRFFEDGSIGIGCGGAHAVQQPRKFASTRIAVELAVRAAALARAGGVFSNSRSVDSSSFRTASLITTSRPSSGVGRKYIQTYADGGRIAGPTCSRSTSDRCCTWGKSVRLAWFLTWLRCRRSHFHVRRPRTGVSGTNSLGLRRVMCSSLDEWGGKFLVFSGSGQLQEGGSLPL